MTEDLLTQKCYIWFHNKYPEHRGLLFHVPNGGGRIKFEAAKMKAMGVYPGVADFLFIWNKKIYAIELKTPTGYQSKDQKKWQKAIEKQGVEYIIVRHVPNFQEVIKTIIKNG